MQSRKNLIFCFTEDHQGKIWMGCYYGLVDIYDTATQRVRYFDVPEFDKKTIMSIACDNDGNIWFGLYNGVLGEWNKAEQQFHTYTNFPTAPTPKGIGFISSILVNAHGEIWIGTCGNGCYRFDSKVHQITECYADTTSNSVIDNNVSALTQINDSIIGVSTLTKGFLLFNQHQKTFTSYSSKNGLPVNSIMGLAQDKHTNFWVGTIEGLFKVNTNTHKVTSFDEEGGLPEEYFSSNFVTLKDGSLAIPSTTGFVYFNPDSIKPMRSLPDVQFTGFKVFDEPLLLDSVLVMRDKTIKLNHQQNFITIEYAAVSFLQRNTIQYTYQLEGVDKNWVNAGTKHTASYTDVNPGHYTFKVKCTNRDGIPTKHITLLHIYIQPPFWATWWAYALYVLAFGGIAYLLYQKNIRRLERTQAAQINAMIATQEEERKRLSRDLHDDIGTKLSALKLFLSSLNDKAESVHNEEIKSLAKSSEQFLKEAIQDVRQLLLNLSPTVLEEFGYITAVEALVNKINETKQLHFSLVVFGMNERLKGEYELALYRITQELINNVLKHAEATQVAIQTGGNTNRTTR